MQDPRLDYPQVEAKRERLAIAMTAAGRWHPGYVRDIASMLEPVLDDLLKYYVGDGGRVHVG